MEVSSLPKRDDFRCGLCRQKGAFHCEHDTPYRDQYLKIYDETTSGAIPANGRISKNEMKTTDTDEESMLLLVVNTHKDERSIIYMQMKRRKQMERRTQMNNRKKLKEAASFCNLTFSFFLFIYLIHLNKNFYFFHTSFI